MRRILLTLCLIIFISTNLLAVDWPARNITVVEKKEIEERTELVLKDAEGHQFMVQYDGTLDEGSAAAIVKLLKIFYAWKNITIDTMRFNVSKQSMSISIFPSKYEYKGKDFLPYLPAGMLFIYTDTLSYNFRLTKDNLFIRIKGEYTYEKLIGDKMTEALKNPHAYIRKRDPEYFLAKLSQLEEDLERTRARQHTFRNEYNKLRYALMYLHNTGVLWGKNPINKKAIERVVEIKKNNPKIKKDDIVKQLDKEKIEISGKELDIILAVYFNEFD